MSEQNEPSEEDKNPCMFCGCALSKDSNESADAFCGNVNCPFSGISIFDEWWESAYCWKSLREAERKAEAYREAAIKWAREAQIESGEGLDIGKKATGEVVDAEAAELLRGKGDA